MNLQDALNDWLEVVKENRSKNTYNTSKAADKEFVKVIGDMPLKELTEEQYSIFLSRLKIHSPSTEKLYASIMYLFFEYLAAKEIHPMNVAALRYMRRYETRKIGKKLREFDRDALEAFRSFVFDFSAPEDALTLARAKAWITLAFESGLRAFELCGLRRNDLNLPKHYGIVTGKGNKEAKFYFTDRTVKAITAYLQMRSRLEAGRGANIPQDNRPLFVSHSKRGFSHLSPIDTDTARADLEQMVTLAIGEDTTITPHVLRHFFIDEFLKQTDNTELARKAARHESMATTQKYLHVDDKEIQAAHRKVFEEGGEK
jgi:site-specific recombinase XerD